jgi:hypothetical protein
MAHANKKQVALYLTDEENEKITKYADKIGISRQKLLANMVNAGLDDLAMMEKYGILTIGVGVRDLLYKFKNKEIDPALLKDDMATDS